MHTFKLAKIEKCESYVEKDL